MPVISIPNNFVPREVGQVPLMRHMDNGGLRAVCVWPRRYGKDLTLAHQTCKAMHRRKGMYLHMLPNHKQARKVMWDGFDNEGNRILDTVFPPAIRASANETEMKIKLKCGSLWQLVGSDYYDSIVGANPIGLVMSEAALSDPRAWNYFRPMLAANGGWAAFISTPRGYNWFQKLHELAKVTPGWFASHLNATMTGHIPADVLAAERREMPDELYRQEYDCDFSAANVGAIFGRYIEQAEAQGRIDTTVEPELDGIPSVVTSDIGFRDKAAFIWWRPMLGGWEIYHYDEASGLDADDWIVRLRGQPHIGTLVLPHDAKAKTFQSKRTVVETFLTSGIARHVPSPGAARKKADSINAGRVVLRRTRFVGQAVVPLLEALRAYHFKYDDEQRTMSSEPVHDWSSHAADALMEGAAYLSEDDTQPAPRVVVPHMTVRQPDSPDPVTLAAPEWRLDELWQTLGVKKERL